MTESLVPIGANQAIRRCASRYLALTGLEAWSFELTALDSARAKWIADQVEAMPHAPWDPRVKAAYEQFAKEVAAQFDFVVSEGGIVFEPWLRGGQPYASSSQMRADLAENNHLYFFTTEAGYGEACDLDNPMREPTGVVLHGYELVYNDMFRAVHDVFGHAMNGHMFGPIGEEQAWIEHSQMFSPLARAALTTESRGQVCWFFFGPHLRDERGVVPARGDPDWVRPEARPYPAQKAGLLPSEVSGVDVSYDPKKKVVVAKALAGWRPNVGIRVQSVTGPPLSSHLPPPIVPRPPEYESYGHSMHLHPKSIPPPAFGRPKSSGLPRA